MRPSPPYLSAVFAYTGQQLTRIASRSSNSSKCVAALPLGSPWAITSCGDAAAGTALSFSLVALSECGTPHRSP
jgi:hypothetical protein